MKSILDRRFRHHVWFSKSGITRRQAIEYFAAHYPDFHLKMKEKRNQSDSLMNETEYYTVLCGDEDGRTWTMTDEEAQYFQERVQFYKKFFKEKTTKDLDSVYEYSDFKKAMANFQKPIDKIINT